MNFPPTPDNLKALAGWALSSKANASPAQETALNKFQDGCEALADNPIPLLPAPRSVPPPAKSTPQAEAFFIPPQDVGATPLERISCQQGGAHRFSIKTQRCLFCNTTYKEARGRAPELM